MDNTAYLKQRIAYHEAELEKAREDGNYPAFAHHDGEIRNLKQILEFHEPKEVVADA